MDEVGSQTAGDAERWARLTDKQRACLDLLVERKTSKQIARELDIAKVTVDQRIRSARDILGASNRDEAAIIYARLKPIYDRMIYDPVGLARSLPALPIDSPNGSKPAAKVLTNPSSVMGRSPSPPHFRARGGATYDGGHFTLAAFSSFIGGVTDRRRAVPIEISPVASFDLTGRIKIAGVADVTVSALNILNAKPEQIAVAAANDTPFDSTNYSAIGRFLALTISRDW